MTSSDAFDPARLALPMNGSPAMPSPTRRLPRRPGDHKFIRGPIPLAWLARAARLPGKTLAVALLIWFLAGLHKDWTVKWEPSKAELFGVSRHAAYRAHGALAEVGLIKIKKQRGKSPMITILAHGAGTGVE
jgi:hypothetical protein